MARLAYSPDTVNSLKLTPAFGYVGPPGRIDGAIDPTKKGKYKIRDDQEDQIQIEGFSPDMSTGENAQQDQQTYEGDQQGYSSPYDPLYVSFAV